MTSPNQLTAHASPICTLKQVGLSVCAVAYQRGSRLMAGDLIGRPA